jgi:CRP-like cAMP-binding protein
MLSPEDWRVVKPRLELVRLELRDTLEEPNKPIDHIYFLESGMGSMVAINAKGEQLEVGIFGREGVSGSTVILGDHRSPHDTFIQLAGSAQRMTANDLRESIKESPTIHALLMHYVQAFMIQTAHTALANGRAKLEERLARWLLMCHDRVDGDELPLTHDFLSLMLGVRRTGVTLALQVLETHGLITTKRGRILIVDRDGLVEHAAGCYGIPEAEYERLVGQPA